MTQKFDQWGIVEIFGHNKIAGRISEQAIGGCSFIRIDVPAVENNQAFTKLLGQHAIYAITFTDEDTATGAAGIFQEKAVDEWSVKKMLEIEQPKSHENELPF